MRAFVPALLLLAGCEAEPGIECALAGGAFERTCRIDRAGGDGLTLRHPDGGFRRIRMEGGVPVAADGAERAAVARRGDMVELAIGGDRYRIPAEALR